LVLEVVFHFAVVWYKVGVLQTVLHMFVMWCCSHKISCKEHVASIACVDDSSFFWICQ